MSINRIGPTSTPAQTGKTRKTGGKGSDAFSKLVGEAGEAGSAGGAGGVQGVGVDAILALQGVEPDEGQQRRARRHGEHILEALDKLRQDILLGAVSEQTMTRLTDLVRQSREEVADPQLREILDDIDLRAQVELAKLEMARDRR